MSVTASESSVIRPLQVIVGVATTAAVVQTHAHVAVRRDDIAAFIQELADAAYLAPGGLFIHDLALPIGF